MTERGSAPVERAAACPFVAFDDDRDERSERPDHRHRCYAELRPAPRAIAHQEAYCLSAGFPACPTFQDWARREAARARRVTQDAAAAAVASAEAGIAQARAEAEPASAPMDSRDAPAEVGAPVEPRAEPPEPRAESSSADERLYKPRPTNRKWASPPPWAAGAAGTAGAAGAAGAAAAGASAGAPGMPPEASGLATSRWLDDGSSAAARPAAASDVDTPAFLAGRAAEADDGDAPGQELAAVAPRSSRPVNRDLSARSGAATERPPSRRPVIGQARPAPHAEHDDGTPSWEHRRRFEAYPKLKRRVGMPTLSRLTIGAIALAVAALLLLMLPALFLGGANQAAKATPSPTASARTSTAPSRPAAPTPLTYTVKPGDTLARIATKFSLTPRQIMAANPAIKDPDKIVIGQVILIPTAGPSDVIDSGPTASPPPSG
jgi:hypothetical protein